MAGVELVPFCLELLGGPTRVAGSRSANSLVSASSREGPAVSPLGSAVERWTMSRIRSPSIISASMIGRSPAMISAEMADASAQLPCGNAAFSTLHPA
jgi:hypothetical protein